MPILSDDNGRIVEFATYGQPDSWPLLYCHGTPGAPSEGAWLDQAATEAGLHVVAIGRSGYGRSRGAAGLPEEVGAARLVRERLGIDRFSVAGFSGGAAFALAIASDSGSDVHSPLILSGFGESAPNARLAPHHRLAMAASSRAPWLLRSAMLLMAGGTLAAPEPLLAAILRRNADRCDRPLLDDAVMSVLARKYRDAFRHGIEGPINDLRVHRQPWELPLSQIVAPVRIWAGRQDRQVPTSVAKSLAARVPEADLRIEPQRGHLGFLASLQGLLDGVAPP